MLLIVKKTQAKARNRGEKTQAISSIQSLWAGDGGSLFQSFQEVFVQGDNYGLHGGFEFVFGQVALPEDNDLPTGIYQIIVILLVTFTVAGYLGLPEVGIGLWKYKLLASFMPVPETAVDKDRRSVFAHNDVRLAGYALDI